MARPLRIEYPGAYYHVMARGNEKQAIYRSSRDRERFLQYLQAATVRYGVVIHCYCLMVNHYHLLVETPAGNLAQIMRYINGAYSNYFNNRHDRVGHLFQGRYRAILVDANNYYLALSRYIHLNPVKEGSFSSASGYVWSSYRAYIHENSAPCWLRTEFLLSLLGNRETARESYCRYVEENPEPFDVVYTHRPERIAVLGGEEFVKQVAMKYLPRQRPHRDLPAAKALFSRPAIKQIADAVAAQLKCDSWLRRKMSIYMCHQYSGCSLKEIGDYFGVGESAVAQTSSRFATLLYKDQHLAETVAGLMAELKM